MTDYINKLEILKEYLFLKIDWDCLYPIMSFDTYQEYRKEEPNIAYWLKVLNDGVKRENIEAKKILEVFDQTGLLLAQTNHKRWMHQQMAAISYEEMLQHYRQERVANSPNRSLLGTIGSPFSAISSLFGITRTIF